MVVHQSRHGGFRWRSVDEIALKRAEMDGPQAGEQAQKGDEEGSIVPSDDRGAPSLDEEEDKKIVEEHVEVV